MLRIFLYLFIFEITFANILCEVKVKSKNIQPSLKSNPLLNSTSKNVDALKLLLYYFIRWR